MVFAVAGHPPTAFRRWQRAFGLVVADGAAGHPTRGGELVDGVARLATALVVGGRHLEGQGYRAPLSELGWSEPTRPRARHTGRVQLLMTPMSVRKPVSFPRSRTTRCTWLGL